MNRVLIDWNINQVFNILFNQLAIQAKILTKHILDRAMNLKVVFSIKDVHLLYVQSILKLYKNAVLLQFGGILRPDCLQIILF